MTQDTEPLEDQAHRVLRKFESINRRDIPTRFEPIVDCLFGAIRQQVRLGREIDSMREKGMLRVDVMVDTKNQIAEELL